MKRYVILVGAVALLVALLRGPLSLARSNVSGGAPGHWRPTVASIAHHYATVDGVRMHYVTAGRGAPLVLLHGYPETWYAWRKVIPALAARYTVIAPDLPGLGASGSPTAYDARTIAGYVHDLVRQLGYRRILLVGHDWGGPVGYAYAARYRADTRALVMVEAWALGFDPPGVLVYSRANAGWLFAFLSQPEVPELLIAGHERAYYTYLYHHYTYIRTAIEPADIDEYVRSYGTPRGVRDGLGFYRAFFTDVDQNRVSARTPLAMPVLAVSGAESSGHILRPALQRVAAHVAEAVRPTCGHFVAEECPGPFVRRLLLFFGGVRD